MSPIANVIRYVVCIATLSGLGACKEVLYSDLSEQHANEMVAVLAASDIAASRNRDKDGVYEVIVDERNVAPAVAILRDEGLPRPTFENLGTVFGADGIVGTPFEEHARFVHAMNEELGRTITEIAGVRTARVHIVIPPKERFREVRRPSSASVTIQTELGFDAPNFVQKVRTLVSHAVESLDYERVAVVLFEGSGPVVVPQDAAAPAGAANAQGLTIIQPFSTPPGSWITFADALAFLAMLAVVLMALRAVVRRLGLFWGGRA